MPADFSPMELLGRCCFRGRLDAWDVLFMFRFVCGLCEGIGVVVPRST